MSRGEIDRLAVIQQVDGKQLGQAEATERLKLSIRQIKRPPHRYRSEGFRPALNMSKIYLHRNPFDFRKNFRGLAAIVEQELGHNSFDGGLHVLTNHQRNKIKCLFWVAMVLSCITKTWPKKSSVGHVLIVA